MSKSKKFVYKEGVTKKHEVLKEAMGYLAKDSYEYLQSESMSTFVGVSAKLLIQKITNTQSIV